MLKTISIITKNNEMDQYGIIGNPINHTWSPRIHQLFAKQTQQQLTYQPILVALNDLPQALDALQARGFKGLNITMPFKQQAFSLVDTCSESAERAQAVNTICFYADGHRFGDNTDGVGLVRDVMQNLKFSIQNKRILILGAGGAVRGIVAPILQQHPSLLVIANRNEQKAEQLVSEYVQDNTIESCSLNKINQTRFDLIINATGTSLEGSAIHLSANLLSQDACCYDMIYNKGETSFMRWAVQHGAAIVVSGLGMLAEQAAESFYIWRGAKPDVQVMLALLNHDQ